MSDKNQKTDDEWRQRLTDGQYWVTRQAGTEPPFSGEFNDHEEEGTYRCVCCGAELFRSDDKFHSGSGWPSFISPAQEEAVDEHQDHSLGTTRTEVACSRCDAHLGHVFPDGPQPTGLRYCINSVALRFDDGSDEDKKKDEE